ncbi:DUF2075 domain-containing protein [Burkholderiaceae bacterium DAT-1]|nr:DUF2075 domain-containing protein [Burkholderiaceae bacterium DAT-1]
MPMTTSSALLCQSFREFVDSTRPDRIEATVRLLADRQKDMDLEAGLGQEGAWRHSLPALANFLQQAELDDEVVVLLEYLLPITRERVDCLILGHDGNRDVAIVVELKQWSAAGITRKKLSNLYEIHPAYKDDDKVERQEKYRSQHPSVQAAAYKTAIEACLDLGQDQPTLVRAFAFLHNFHAIEHSVLSDDPSAAEAMFIAPLVGASGESYRTAMQEIRELQLQSPAHPQRFLQPEVRFSHKLFFELQDLLDNRFSFPLAESQSIIMEMILGALEHARHPGRSANGKVSKYHIVVDGGVGTGKSVLALTLLRHLIRQSVTALYAVGSKSLIQNAHAQGGSLKNVINYFFPEYYKDDQLKAITLIFDEAHRTKKPGNFKTAMKSAKACVFFIDDRQIIHPTESCSGQQLENFAKELSNNTVTHRLIKVSLTEQFRCCSGNRYINWLEKVFYPDESPGYRDPEQGYEVRIVDTPEALEELVLSRRQCGHDARMLAGFCWPWSDPGRNKSNPGHHTLTHDVAIGTWSAPWNEKPPEQWEDNPQDKPAADQHPFYLWATDPQTRQVGCIYSSQGLEFDYVGVIIGPDLIWDRQQQAWRGQLQHSHDTKLKKGFKSANNPDPTEILKNIYWVLATRGVKGVFFYSTDADTRDYLKECLRLAHPVNRTSETPLVC